MVILISVTMTRSLISFSRSRMNRKTEIILLTLNVSIFCQIIDVLWWPLWFDKKSISGSLPTMARISLIKVKLVKCRRGGWFVSDFVLQITDELQNRETLNVSIFLLIRSLKSKIWLKSISWLLTNFRWASFCSWNSSNDDENAKSCSPDHGLVSFTRLFIDGAGVAAISILISWYSVFNWTQKKDLNTWFLTQKVKKKKKS